MMETHCVCFYMYCPKRLLRGGYGPLIYLLPKVFELLGFSII